MAVTLLLAGIRSGWVVLRAWVRDMGGLCLWVWVVGHREQQWPCPAESLTRGIKNRKIAIERDKDRKINVKMKVRVSLVFVCW